MTRLFGREIELLCLDLDDTLIDTEAGAPRRFEDATRAIRRRRPDISTRVIERAAARAIAVEPNRGRFANFVADLGLSDADEIQRIRDAYLETMPSGLVLFEGAADVLVALRRRFQLAIITNGPSELQRRKIAHFALEPLVDWVIVSGEIGVEKPDPAIFERALELAEVQASRAAHVGDSLVSDVAGANGAGLLSIWVETRFPRDPAEHPRFRPDVTISHVRDLLEALEAGPGNQEVQRT